MARPGYAAHEALVGPARARPQIWRLIAGLALAATVAFALNTALYSALRLLDPGQWAPGESGAPGQVGNTPASLLILLGSFGFVTFGVLLAARTLQDRRVTDVIGVPALAVRQFWKVLRMLVFIGLVAMVLPPYGDGDAVRIEQNLDPVLWLMLLPLSLLALLLQTSAEEILFRGYLQQSLAARFRHPLIWIGIPSVLFAFGHYLPAEAGENAGIIMVWAALFGVLMADLTARAGTLGPAIAVHLANNFTAILIVSAPGSLNGLSLLVLPFGLSDTEHMRAWLAVDFASMIVAWLGARLAIRA